jgi:MFS family permease
MSTATSVNSSRVGYVALVRRNRNFRYLWWGQIISLLGDWFNLIASASLVAELSQSGLAIGGLFVVRMLAPFLVSPLAGLVADRYNRKQILILADITRAITVCGFLLVQKPEHVWFLYALTAVQLGISGFFFPTRNAILPEIVSSGELGAANALSAATWSVMLALGAALGGLAAGTWGNRPAFIIDAVTFLASALLIAQIGYRPDPTLQTVDKSLGTAVQQYLDGFRYLRQHLDILLISLHKPAISLLVSGGYQVIQVELAERIFPIGAGGGISLGLIYAVVGIGTGIGPILARRITGDRDRLLRVAIVFGYAAASLGLFITVTLRSFEIVLFGAVLRGIGAGITWVFSTQLLLQLVPNQIRGRVFATEFALQTLMSAAGSAIAGATIDTSLGISGMLLWMAILTLVPGLLWALLLMSGRFVESVPDENL